mmetsp:Transcript_27981/g.39342  ORF Transcript_27981/g.39342 Transcript_27981/m.39342 type:complete len:765 (-) Transcript_27981:35-2329(-)
MPYTSQNGHIRKTARLNTIFVCVVACLAGINFSDGFSTSPLRTSQRVLTGGESKRIQRKLITQVVSTAVIAENVPEMTVDEYVTDQVNSIHPKTQSLLKSMYSFARFALQRNLEIKALAKGEKNKSKKESWWSMLKTLNEQRRNLVHLAGYNANIIVPSFSFLLLGALMVSIVPHYYSEAITCVASNEASPIKLAATLSGLAVTSTLAAFFTGMRGSLFWIAGSRANYNVRVKLHRTLLMQEAAFFDSNEVGYLLSRLNNDVNKIGMVISFHVNVVLRQFAQFLFGSVYLLKISPKLAAFAFGGIGLIAIVSVVYGAFAHDLAEKVQDTFADATAVAETSFSMSETIRAFNGVKAETTKYEGAQSRALDLEEVQAWAYGAHKFVSDTLQTALQVGLLFACWNIGRADGLPAAKLTTFLFYANFVLESSNEVGDQWAKIMSAVGASTSVFDLIRRIPKIRDLSQREKEAIAEQQSVPSVEKNGLEPIIKMSNVTITYDEMSNPALKEIDLNVYPGDRIAVVGRSGSGKSSMLRTILRFYDPSSGSADVCGKQLKYMSREELASHISVVAQEPDLFPMTLIENVMYGIEKDDIDKETGEPCYSEKYRTKVADCLKLAGLSVAPGNSLGLELDTRVGEGGRTLSGGQRQRAAIARALIRSPEILLLDEPTAALDSQSEKKVVEALKLAMEQTKSMAMVTHRLGVVRSLGVNRVIVLDKGQIAEMGHPEELLKKENGLYAALAREQGITAMAPPGVVTDRDGVSHSFQ